MFHVIIIQKLLTCQMKCHIYYNNKILATLLNYCSLRHVNQSDFLDHHEKEIMKQCIVIIATNVNIKTKVSF